MRGSRVQTVGQWAGTLSVLLTPEAPARRARLAGKLSGVASGRTVQGDTADRLIETIVETGGGVDRVAPWARAELARRGYLGVL